jgi:ABC-2 type transport system permease protein
MRRAGTLAWFAAHEARLAWRDWVALVTGGGRRRTVGVVAGAAVMVAFLHGVAWLTVGPWAGVAASPDQRVLLAVTGVLLSSGSLMLSQALESATRLFYARGDLDLVLASPAVAPRLFAVRALGVVAGNFLLTMLLAAPFVHVLAWLGGLRWLAAYAAMAALAMLAGALALLLTLAMFRAFGPRRTRTVAQILAAVVGAAFAIGVQFAAIASTGALASGALGRLALLARFAPGEASLVWWPARALLGEPVALAALLALGIAALLVAIRLVAPRFGAIALQAGSVAATTGSAPGRAACFASGRAAGEGSRAAPARGGVLRSRSPAQALRRKEWTLLLRDPWLLSQSLMQLLYLLPAAFLLWFSLYAGSASSAVLVPVLVVAAGQLAGGLAWLAVSGEDAPELIATAPVRPSRVLRAKAEAVLAAVGAVFAPLVLLLAIAAPLAALAAAAGILVAAASATAIQFWFRTQARRSHFRRRQTSSRIASVAEALSSIGWAGAAALAAAGTWLAVFPAILTLAILFAVRVTSPARRARDRRAG